jgi:hypothetical protein
MDDIKRITSPTTKNGHEWEVRLSTIPAREWLDLFKLSGEGSVTAVPRRVVFDRDAAFFKCEEQHVEHWIRSIDKWIASTNARSATRFEQESRDRVAREESETKERERIHGLNERFKDL